MKRSEAKPPYGWQGLGGYSSKAQGIVQSCGCNEHINHPKRHPWPACVWGRRAWPTSLVAAQETLRVAVSTNGSFTRLSRCCSFSPHLTLRFGSILSLLPKPSSCPRNLSQFSYDKRLPRLFGRRWCASASIPSLQFLIRIASVFPTETHLTYWPFPLFHCRRCYSSRCWSFCTVTSTPKYLGTSAKFGWRIVTSSRTRCLVRKVNDAPL